MSGGHKRQYRRIDFRRDSSPFRRGGRDIEYGPQRPGIAALHYGDGREAASSRPKLKRRRQRGSRAGPNPRPENADAVVRDPVGTAVHNVS